jgi:4-amino-4-deoxy-L-arabinose transferase-like glycosyltransferase
MQPRSARQVEGMAVQDTHGGSVSGLAAGRSVGRGHQGRDGSRIARPPSRRAQRWLLAGICVLAILGQVAFATIGGLVVGSVLYILAGVGFLALVARHSRAAPGGRVVRWAEGALDAIYGIADALTVRAFLAAAALTAGAAAAVSAHQHPPPANYSVPLGLWLLGLALLPAAYMPWSGVAEWGAQASAWAREYRGELAVVAGISLVAGILRFWQLDSIPFIIAGDEAEMGVEARRFITGDTKNMFDTGWLSHPKLYFFIMSFPIRMLGNEVLALRLVAALAATLAIPALYILARETFDRWIATAAAVLLAASHFHIHYSRLGLNNIVDTLFISLALFGVIRGRRTDSSLALALGGIAIGLSQYFYMGSKIIPIVVVSYAAYVVATDPRSWRRHLRQFGIVALGALVAAFPLLLFYKERPDTYLVRAYQVALIPPGGIAELERRAGKGALVILWDQFLKSFFAFNFYRDATPWYRPTIPLLDFVSSMFFLLGLVWTMARARDARCLAIMAWFWYVIFLGGVLTENPPSSQRLVIIAPVVTLLAAVGLVKVLEIARAAAGLNASTVRLCLAALLIGVAVYNVQYYFLDYTPSRAFNGAPGHVGNPEIADRVGRFLSGAEPGSRVHFLGLPRLFYGTGSIRYFAPHVPGVDLPDPVTTKPPEVRPGERTIFIAIPERTAELEWVSNRHPGGLMYVEQRETGQVIFQAYTLEATAGASSSP